MRPKLVLSLLAAATVSWGSLLAEAQPTDDVTRARDLFREGSSFAEAGDWEAARVRFARSLELHRAALTLYNLGIAQQETGHIVDAVDSFRAFLAMPVEPATQRYVDAVRTTVPQLEGRIALVQVDVRPADARHVVLRVDGREVQRTPGGQRMDPGHHEIVAVAPGYCEAHQTADVIDGARTSVAMTLAPPAPSAERPSQAVPVALVVGGLALFAGGEAAFGVGLGDGPGPGQTRTAVAGNVLGAAGAVAATVGVVLLITRSHPRSSTTAVAPWVAGNVGGVSVRF